MKRILTLILFSLSTQLLLAQTPVDSLVQLGVKHHDQGDYTTAIDLYKKALAIDPNSALANYELASTYMYAKEYEKALIHCDKVLELDDRYLVLTYVTKGSCLDLLGRTDESIKLFEKGIKKFGDNHLLYYNLGFDYYKIKNYDKAKEALVNAIETKSDHASSHLLLGYVMADLNKKVQSLLSLHYFLFLEPGSERAKTAYALLQSQFGGNAAKDPSKPDQINIFFDPGEANKEFGPAELMVAMLEASNSLEENKDKTRDELFIENTTSFFKVLGELNQKKNKGLWWDFYVPFFYQLAKSEHIDTYCYYISASSSSGASEWMKKNADKVEKFDAWLRER